MKKIYLFLVCLALFFSCEDDEMDTENGIESSSIEWIGYGTSFGECLGYCIKDLSISEDTVEFVTYSWTDDLSYPDIQCGQDFTEWSTLIAALEEFDYMYETFGCPDCADGGSEWIEVLSDGIRYKATFEFMNEPEQFTSAVDILRPTMASFDDCE